MPGLRKLTIPAPVSAVRQPSVSYPRATTPAAIRSPRFWTTGAISPGPTSSKNSIAARNPKQPIVLRVPGSYRPASGRYEPGTLNTIGCFGLRAAIEFLLEVGPGEIAPVVQNLGDRIAAGVVARGYETLGCRTAETGAGIVSFRKPGIPAEEIVKRLRETGISAAARAGWVRTSPHFYISPQEIDTFLAALP